MIAKFPNIHCNFKTALGFISNFLRPYVHGVVPRGRKCILKLSGFACNVLRAKQKKVAACASVLNYVSVNV